MAGPRFEEIGDRLTRALVRGDFGLYRDLMALPLKIVPREGQSYVLADPTRLREDFEAYHAVIHLNGVTDIFRQIVSQAGEGPGRWRVHCLTHILARAHRLMDPFATRFLLVETGEGWRICEIESSESHITWTLGRAELIPRTPGDAQGGTDDAED